MTRRRKLAVITVEATGSPGGAERFYGGLTAALQSEGYEVDVLQIECDERSFEGILEGYARAAELDLDCYWGVISTKSPTFAATHPNHVVYLVHTVRVFYDMYQAEFNPETAQSRQQRSLIFELDRLSLSPPRSKTLFTIGQEVSSRLDESLHLRSEVLRIPTSLEGLRSGSFNYCFLPGRLHRWKRVDLNIEAFKQVDRDVELIIAGDGEDEPGLRAAAASDPRIRFVGRVDEETLRELYSNALVVLFAPLREDFGFVATEAFASGKPVITVADAGEPARMVIESGGGFVCSPDAGDVASRIVELVDRPDLAMELGHRGKTFERKMTWNTVAKRLSRALGD